MAARRRMDLVSASQDMTILLAWCGTGRERPFSPPDPSALEPGPVDVDPYLSLFTVAFLAATLLPAYSEILLVGLLAGGHDPLALWAWATAGNTLGASVNWLLGRYLLAFRERRWFPFKPDQLERAQGWFQHWGVWALLMAWAPIVGDALTFIAGLMRVRFDLFLLLTAIGKGARYAIVLGLTQGVGIFAS